MHLLGILAILWIGCFMILAPSLWAEERKVTIIQPANYAIVTNPFKVCMSVEGLVLEPADMGITEGHGHHHILFSSLPKDLSKPIPRKKAIHLVEAEECVKLKMEPGKHVIFALFAYADHVAYNPLIMDKILITIKE